MNVASAKYTQRHCSLHLCLLSLCICQLPSPTAMGAALRGISCYLREVLYSLTAKMTINKALTFPDAS